MHFKLEHIAEYIRINLGYSVRSFKNKKIFGYTVDSKLVGNCIYFIGEEREKYREYYKIHISGSEKMKAYVKENLLIAIKQQGLEAIEDKDDESCLEVWIV